MKNIFSGSKKVILRNYLVNKGHACFILYDHVFMSHNILINIYLLEIYYLLCIIMKNVELCINTKVLFSIFTSYDVVINSFLTLYLKKMCTFCLFLFFVTAKLQVKKQTTFIVLAHYIKLNSN